MSEKEKNENRLFHCKGVSIDPRLISFVYILDILFCLVTLVTGSFNAFIEAFIVQKDIVLNNVPTGYSGSINSSNIITSKFSLYTNEC